MARLLADTDETLRCQCQLIYVYVSRHVKIQNTNDCVIHMFWFLVTQITLIVTLQLNSSTTLPVSFIFNTKLHMCCYWVSGLLRDVNNGTGIEIEIMKGMKQNLLTWCKCPVNVDFLN